MKEITKEKEEAIKVLAPIWLDFILKDISDGKIILPVKNK